MLEAEGNEMSFTDCQLVLAELPFQFSPANRLPEVTRSATLSQIQERDSESKRALGPCLLSLVARLNQKVLLKVQYFLCLKG